MEEPRSATTARRDELVELVNLVRRELRSRGESPSGNWVEDLAEDLHTGRVAGWFYPTGPAAALGFESVRGEIAFGHAHVEDGPGAIERAEHLVDVLRERMPPTARAIDIGLSGLPAEEERALWVRLKDRPGASIVERRAMVRPITVEDAAVEPRLPVGYRAVAVEAVTLDALADLDWRAFRNTVDAELFGSNLADYRRVLEELFDHRLGRYLPEASIAIVNDEGTALCGALIASEQSPRQATYLDIMVDPDRQRAGLGRFLVRSGFRALRALGYESVRLWVTEANLAARTLYEQNGFEPTASASIYRWARAGSDAQPHSG